MILTLVVKQERGNFEVFIPAEVPLPKVVAQTKEKAITRYKVMALHWIAEEILNGRLPPDSSIYFNVEDVSDLVPFVETVNISDLSKES